MSDTVFIFGAGFSYDSGIPLLSGFVDQMLRFYNQGKCNGKNLSEDDLDLFRKADEIRNELDGYHGRARFDDRNIEDLLSILSFNEMTESANKESKLNTMTRAIARTIELSCNITAQTMGPFTRRSMRTRLTGPDVYREFWQYLIRACRNGKSEPSIITFNYDLVLERSLLQTLYGVAFWDDNPFPLRTVEIYYRYKNFDPYFFSLEHASYRSGSEPNQRKNKKVGGFEDEDPEDRAERESLRFDILKLHGSLNFPNPDGKRSNPFGDNPIIGRSLDDPYILPPVFNKMGSAAPLEMWKRALDVLRRAKRIVIVGYSLPRTDVYMQYFLKAGIGPNKYLDRVVVFDPVLHYTHSGNTDMRERFSNCFSQQMNSRLVFQPSVQSCKPGTLPGTTAHFVEMLRANPDFLMY